MRSLLNLLRFRRVRANVLRRIETWELIEVEQRVQQRIEELFKGEM